MRTFRSNLLIALTAALALSACTTARPPGGFDFRAREPAVRGGSPCERAAFETGRQRYDLLERVNGAAYASFLANRAAERAYERCRSGAPA